MSERVLVVDDEPQILRALAINLRARGYDVDLAPSGEDALRMAADHHPDVVILDLGLPGISGIDVIRGLRGWSSVPIIILSAREAEADKIAALDAGADDYVTKPFGAGEPAGHGADPGEQFFDGKRFGDVVVGAGVEGVDLVAAVGPPGQDQNRQGGPRA